MERSLILLKPDAVEQKLCGEVIHRFEGLPQFRRVAALKVLRLTPELLRMHYAHLVDKPFYPPIEAFMISDDVWAMIIEGESGLVQAIRDLLGPTDSAKAPPETIRGQFGSTEVIARNIAHASDSPEAAEKEIGLFFPEEA